MTPAMKMLEAAIKYRAHAFTDKSGETRSAVTMSDDAWDAILSEITGGGASNPRKEAILDVAAQLELALQRELDGYTLYANVCAAVKALYILAYEPPQ